jgi:Methyltransferase domain
MSHVLEHFPKDEIVPTLQKIRPMLNDGGRLLVIVPNAQSNTGCYWAYEDFTHSTLFTAGSLSYVLRLAGFKTVTFMDVDCMYGRGFRGKVIRKFLSMIYRKNMNFWNWVTNSSYHLASERIYSYDIKALATK